MRSKALLPASNFIHTIVENDVQAGVHDGQVITRFPPEPNGYLHIGHCKSILLNFGLADDFCGRCHLRLDDTNPETENAEYVESIKTDIEWLGFSWGEHLYYASDYFEKLYEIAEQLIEKELAYVCDLSEEELREYRGDFNRPGKDSPFRNRSKNENLDLFRRMRNGEFADGQKVLRAKIDMRSPNMNMRDPILYRIKKVSHYRTKDRWNIYPMYDYAHPVSDALENITHSTCTLEFQDHRPLYDWCVEHSGLRGKPRQYEFARLDISYLVMSKRKLLQLVQERLVNGWDDPRLPTISGLRRRGIRPEALRHFVKRIGVSKAESVIDIDVLESYVKADLEQCSKRAMVVLNPIKVLVTNYPDGKSEKLISKLHPRDESYGARELQWDNELFIERDDFSENPPDDFFRLEPGGRVRLKNAYVIECEKLVKNSDGEVVELHCKYLPGTLGGKIPADGRKVRGIIHWVSAKSFASAEIRMYGRLFTVATPEAEQAGSDFRSHLDYNSLKVIRHAKLEKNLGQACMRDRFQFERVGYFTLDCKDSESSALIFNKIVDL